MIESSNKYIFPIDNNYTLYKIFIFWYYLKGGIKILAYVLIFIDGKEKETIEIVRGLEKVKEAYICNLGRGDLIGMAKVEGAGEKEIGEYVNKKIRSLDSVNSTGIFTVREDRENLRDKRNKEEEKMIEEEEEEEEDDWGPWGPIRKKRG